MNQDDENKGIDLSGSLDNSSSKIKFEGEEFQRPARSFESQTPKVIEWIIKYSGGYIKDERQASYAVLGFVALAIIISLFLFFSSGNSQESPSEEEVRKIDAELFQQ